MILEVGKLTRAALVGLLGIVDCPLAVCDYEHIVRSVNLVK